MNLAQKKQAAPTADIESVDRSKLTPMMAQYAEVKTAHPDCLLFYRMGDFYEMFFDDAIAAAKALDIALTKRGQIDEADIPMCGVPFHSYESYLNKLIAKGFKVAICEQIESPDEAKERAKREGGKALVKRDVVRIVTQGTLTEDAQLSPRENNYLSCFSHVAGKISVALTDISTGHLHVEDLHPHSLPAFIERYRPSEIIVSEQFLAQHENLYEFWAAHKDKLTVLPPARFDVMNATKRLHDYYNVSTLDGFGEFNSANIAAAGLLLDYIYLTQKGKMPRLSAPQKINHGGHMEIDAATRRSLEISHGLNGKRETSLLNAIDCTATGAGARLLNLYLSMPLTDMNVINHRLDRIEFFTRNTQKRADTREILKNCPDIERALSRVHLDRGGPRDLASIRDSIDEACRIRDTLRQGRTPTETLDPTIPPSLASALQDLELSQTIDDLRDALQNALKDDLPLLARDGGFIRAGFAPHLDELRSLKDDSRKHIAALEQDYKSRTDIATLKIKHNNVIGFFIEVPATQGQKLFDDTEKLFIHRQTMASGVRFTTVALNELEQKISSADDKILALELQLFDRLITDVKNATERLRLYARALAEIDVASAMADLAVRQHYTRPHLFDDTRFVIEQGRHPVVEKYLPHGTQFIANDCTMQNDTRIWLLTGPNMAGKSTFLRQNALIAIMAQAGLYVPATRAEIGLIDKLFSRVGASDDLARGQSTFMVEMVETAAILNQSTPKSFVILDELGRGTSTFDGLSIAWAALEQLHEDNKCRTLFATHYHELTALEKRLNSLACYTMRIKEWDGEIVFLHEVINGTADQSYGIHVAHLAGLPEHVINRAREILNLLETGKGQKNTALLEQDLPLFSAAPAPAKTVTAHPLVTALQNIDPDTLRPVDALTMLYDLCQRAKQGDK